MMLHPSGHVTSVVPMQPQSYKPKVGLAVICRCCSGNSYVQCLLQKRGPQSSSPDKWSFPGGRLEQPGDLEDDGAVGTKRELEEECGGGEPPGLPPLIHIECCKSGKVSQSLHTFSITVYHLCNILLTIFTILSARMKMCRQEPLAQAYIYIDCS